MRIKRILKEFGVCLLYLAIGWGIFFIVGFLILNGWTIYEIATEYVKNPSLLIHELTKHNSTINDSKKAIEIINGFRAMNHKKAIKFDIRAYNLALARAKDMYERCYFSHETPEGKTVYDIKHLYGFSLMEGTAECIYAEFVYQTPYDEEAKFGSYYEGIEKVAIKVWMNSYEHRKILLDSAIYKGSVACYEGVCVFIGVHPERITEDVSKR